PPGVFFMPSKSPDLVTCNSRGCGHLNAPSADFCARCGSPLEHITARGDTVPTIDDAGSPAIQAVGYSSQPPGADDSPDEKERYWYHNVYQGDKVKQLTFRAVMMGGILGMFMSISNLYTTLQLGWSFGVAITACVLSYVIWNGIRAISGGELTQMS